MNGLELSESYYNDCGYQIFADTFKGLMDCIAVGLVGPGSECLGFDDEHSRDHDWGPSFCLWLRSVDFVKYGKEFQDCYNNLPKGHKGFGSRIASPGETGRVGPIDLTGFYSRYTGQSQVPETLQQWDIPSMNMSLCTNGKVFSDPLGEFTLWREKLLQFYPEDLRLKKIADCCMKAGQAGQYNWQRGIMRSDPFVISSAKISFCTEIMNLVYLLNKRYAPYFKWLFTGMKQLPLLGVELTPLVNKLLVSNDELYPSEADWDSQQATITVICDTVIKELQNQSLTDMEEGFLIDNVPQLLGRIVDQEFRKRLWMGR